MQAVFVSFFPVLWNTKGLKNIVVIANECFNFQALYGIAVPAVSTHGQKYVTFFLRELSFKITE